jgi:hypothetical protein
MLKTMLKIIRGQLLPEKMWFENTTTAAICMRICGDRSRLRACMHSPTEDYQKDWNEELKYRPYRCNTRSSVLAFPYGNWVRKVWLQSPKFPPYVFINYDVIMTSICVGSWTHSVTSNLQCETSLLYMLNFRMRHTFVCGTKCFRG